MGGPRKTLSARQPFAPIDFKTRFPALDGIRALAVTMVFLAHYGGGGTRGGPLLRFLNAARIQGVRGVDLFFVLSGFLITGILFDTRNDARFFRRFFARRSLRIFPVVYLLFAILALLTPIFHYQWHWKQASFLLYLGNFFGNQDFSLYGLKSVVHPHASATLDHFWSLCVEEQFYLLWPIVVWLIADRVKLLHTVIALCVATLLLRMTAVHLWSPATAELWITRTLPFRLDALLFGALLALLLRGPAAETIQRASKWVFAAGILLLALTEKYSLDRTSPLALTLGLSATAIASMGLIGITLRPESITFRIFHWHPARTLGKYSYGFYLWHLVWQQAWVSVLAFVYRRTGSAAKAGLVELPLAFLTTFLVAKLSYDLFEARFLRLKRHFEYDSEVQTNRTAFAPDGN